MTGATAGLLTDFGAVDPADPRSLSVRAQPDRVATAKTSSTTTRFFTNRSPSDAIRGKSARFGERPGRPYSSSHS